MEDYKDGTIRKSFFIDEFGTPIPVYIAKVLKANSLDDLVSSTQHLQIVKYPNGNYCLVPANENVSLDDEGTSNIDLIAQDMQNNDIIAGVDWRRVEGYTAQDYYEDTPHIADGEIIP